MNRRRAISVVAAALAASPSTALAQRSDSRRRVGILMDQPDGDTGRERIAAFHDALKGLGWNSGQTVVFETLWGASSLESARPLARAMVAVRPDVILAAGSPAVASLLQTEETPPIVFTSVTDPVASGFVASLARPGGKATGFTTFEYSLSAKWVELLVEISPSVRYAIVLYDPDTVAGVGQLDVIRRAAEAARIAIRPVDARLEADIVREFAVAGRAPSTGAIVTGSPSTGLLREAIIKRATEARVPTVYPYSHFVSAGGLVAYGPSLVEPFAKAAAYVDRILRGAAIGSLPVQAPTRYFLSVNLGAAKTAGLTIDSHLLARADEVIE